MLSGLVRGNRSVGFRPRRGGSSSSPPPSGGDVVDFTFTSNGDTNGVFYYLGTNRGTTSWSNPHPKECFVTITGGTANGERLINRLQSSNAEFYTDNVANAQMQVDLSIGLQFLPNYYTLQMSDSFITRSWNFQGSNDATTWDTLHSVVNQTYSAYQWVGNAIAPPDRYRYFRILQTGLNSNGDNYLCVSELEMYGTLYI